VKREHRKISIYRLVSYEEKKHYGGGGGGENGYVEKGH